MDCKYGSAGPARLSFESTQTRGLPDHAPRNHAPWTVNTGLLDHSACLDGKSIGLNRFRKQIVTLFAHILSPHDWAEPTTLSHLCAGLFFYSCASKYDRSIGQREHTPCCRPIKRRTKDHASDRLTPLINDWPIILDCLPVQQWIAPHE